MRAEIIAAPLTVWLAPVDTAFPDVGMDPGIAWFKLGTTGDENYDDAGVTASHDATYNEFTGASSTVAIKAWRVTEAHMIEFELVDLSPDQYAKVLNDATVTDTAAGAGTAGTSSFDIMQGVDVAVFALIARGISSVEEDMAAQYQVPTVYQAASPKPVHAKGKPAGLACQFKALKHPSLGLGKVVIQTADAS